MTDSYKVQTSQLPNFPDENTKRDEKQENFFLPPGLIPPLRATSLAQLGVLNFSSNFICRIERAV